VERDDLFEQARSAEDPLVRMRAYGPPVLQVSAALRARIAVASRPGQAASAVDRRANERYLAAFHRGLEDSRAGRTARRGRRPLPHLLPGAQPILREYRDRLPDHTETIDRFLEKGTYRIRATQRAKTVNPLDHAGRAPPFTTAAKATSPRAWAAPSPLEFVLWMPLWGHKGSVLQ